MRRLINAGVHGEEMNVKSRRKNARHFAFDALRA